MSTSKGTLMDKARQALLLFGPIATLSAGLLALQGVEAAAFSWAAILLWSPLPIGVPALLTQNIRDAALPGVSGMTRAAMLLPHLLLEARDRNTALSLAGWIGALPLALSL